MKKPADKFVGWLSRLMDKAVGWTSRLFWGDNCSSLLLFKPKDYSSTPNHRWQATACGNFGGVMRIFFTESLKRTARTQTIQLRTPGAGRGAGGVFLHYKRTAREQRQNANFRCTKVNARVAAVAPRKELDRGAEMRPAGTVSVPRLGSESRRYISGGRIATSQPQSTKKADL